MDMLSVYPKRSLSSPPPGPSGVSVKIILPPVSSKRKPLSSWSRKVSTTLRYISTIPQGRYPSLREIRWAIVQHTWFEFFSVV